MSGVLTLVVEKDSSDGNCRNVLLFNARPPPPGGDGGGDGKRGSDVLMCHADAVGEMRRCNAAVPYIQYQAKIARAHAGRVGRSAATFMSRCVAHTADVLEEEIRDAQSMTKLGNYLNAVSVPLAHYRECMREPQHHFVGDVAVGGAASMYLGIVQFIVLQIIMHFVPRLKAATWGFLGAAAPAVSPHHAAAEDDGVELSDDETCRSAEGMPLDEGLQAAPVRNTRPSASAARTMYQRKLYFRSSITEYQGQQKRVVPETVMRDVETHLRMNNLVDQAAASRRERYRAVTCDATYNALRETDNPKWYRDVYLIHAVITDQPCLPCIRHLEAALMRDFEVVSERFNRFGLSLAGRDGGEPSAGLGRSNFLNSNYVLFQLLRKNGYPCEFSSFFCLRTLNSRVLHDDICEHIFTDLGWPFVPTCTS